MNYLSTSLNGKGLLSLLIAYTLSGTALADVAGRVNFVSGNVEVIATDGSRRALVKGELVNSGERLETNRGRVQIRFTDGSFISLQPNTVFGLDKYSFDKNKPNDGSLLFNFLRGGMRTVSGAIGKVNRANYKVQTPVATIGIRGTSYAANQEPNGKLLLTVGSGIVNLENNFGFSNVNTGQTFQVETGQAPNQAPAGTTV
ncbi:MAG TPA: FecR domain-containing protein, partial [Agitococcus sp.]|nr:FecR domain-containing protein [Agitococcus sp.]